MFEAHHTTKKAKSKSRYGGGMAEVLTSPPALGDAARRIDSFIFGFIST
jgi:hypothetical protein